MCQMWYPRVWNAHDVSLPFFISRMVLLYLVYQNRVYCYELSLSFSSNLFFACFLSPRISITTLYTFLWCLWKERIDALFGRKLCNPWPLFPVANAIIQGSKLDDMMPQQEQHQQPVPLQDPFLVAGNVIFCDAAWKKEGSIQSSPAGIGIIIQFGGNRHSQQLHVSALSPPVSSPLQADAYELLLATMLADALHIQEPNFFKIALSWRWQQRRHPSSNSQSLLLYRCPQLSIVPE